MRRRARFLRKARELALRDLGGLVFDMHRFGQPTSEALLAKLATLRQVDAELRGLERALGEGNGVTVLREVGIAACPRCAAIHGRDDRFCPGCGLAFDRDAERPIATSPVSIPGPQAPAGGAQAAQGAATGTTAPGTASAAATATPSAPASSGVDERVEPTERPETAERKDSGEHEEQPTQILRPPAGGG
jgi:hypothetical protein